MVRPFSSDVPGRDVRGRQGIVRARINASLYLVEMGAGGESHVEGAVYSGAGRLLVGKEVHCDWLSEGGVYIIRAGGTTASACSVTLIDPGSGITNSDDAIWATDNYVASLVSTGTVEILDFTTGAWGAVLDSQAFGVGSDTMAISPDNRFIAVVGNVSPFVKVHAFDPATGLIGAAVANPATLPNGSANGVRWSPDGLFIAVAHGTTPFMSVYPWADGFGAKVAAPAVPTGMSSARVPAWTTAMDAIIFTHAFSGVSPPDPNAVTAHAWAWSAAGFGALLTGFPVVNDLLFDVQVHPKDDGLVAFSGDGSDDPVKVYDFSSATGFGSKLAAPACGPELGSSIRVSWHPDGTGIVGGFLGSGGGRDEEARFFIANFKGGAFATCCSTDLDFQNSGTAQFNPAGTRVVISGGFDTDELLAFDVVLGGAPAVPSEQLQGTEIPITPPAVI